MIFAILETIGELACMAVFVCAVLMLAVAAS